MPPTDTRIAQLRQAMRRRGLDAYIVPSADPHLSEYLPARWQGRQWASGFTGSVGTLVVTADFAGLWVDSRYWVQAEAQLAGTCVRLMKIAAANTPGHVDWLAAHRQAGQQVGVDGQVLGLAAFRALSAALAPAGVGLDIQADLLSDVWPDRPGLPDAPVYAHEPPYACVSRADKLAQLRHAMRAHGADVHLVSTLDDIAWLFNLRGADVSDNPRLLAHALRGPHPARGRCVVQPGVPGACPGRPRPCHAIRGRRQDRRGAARGPGGRWRRRGALRAGGRGPGLARTRPDPADRSGPRHLRRVPRHGPV